MTCKYEVLKVVFFLSWYKHLLRIIIFSISILEHIYCFQIKFAQDRDAGIYECQVSTSTGTISRRVNLNVIYPEAFIKGGEEYYVDEGSPISLTCVIGMENKRMKDIVEQLGIAKYN